MDINLTEWIYDSIPPAKIIIALILTRIGTNISYRIFSVYAILKNGEKEVRFLTYFLRSVVPHVFVGGLMALIVTGWYIRMMYNERD